MSADCPFAAPEEVRHRLDAVDYLVDDGLAMALFLALRLGRPLLLEGEPGVGKTAAAKALARALDTTLIRLQCYEGLGVPEALYEWNHQRQLLAIRLAEARSEKLGEADLFTAEFLLERPILRAVRQAGPVPPVLLIDEIDRADDEFEALLFEFLGEAAITVPELGTFTAVRPPIVVLTSNRSRELHDALRRRCLYHWIDYPSAERAAEILRRTVPGADAALITAATAFIGHVRGLELDKSPGMAETIDWVAALSALGVTELIPDHVIRTLGAIAKTPDDRDLIAAALPGRTPGKATMKITNEFAVNTPIDRAWAVLTDLEGIAPCLPGARLTGVEGDTYAGRVKVKVGPVVSDFAGTARFLERDEQAHRAVIDAKGRDSRSAGNAAAVVTAQLRPDGDRTLVSVDTDLKISGKLAQFGSGMIKEVSGKLLGQFVANLEAKLAAGADPLAAAGAGPAPVPSPGPDDAVTPPPAVRPVVEVPVVEAPVAAAPSTAGEPVRLRDPAGFDSRPDDEPEALDLLGLAGGSVYKRLIPLGIGVAVVAAVIIWVVVRR